jgi:mediator of RNA polymerase II transcription subunit 27
LKFERLDWLKSASTLTSLNESLDEHNYRGSNKRRLGSMGMLAPEKVAVVELLFPSIFRAVISLHPAGSTDPDAVAFFSPDEVYLYLSWFVFPNIFINIFIMGCELFDYRRTL